MAQVFSKVRLFSILIGTALTTLVATSPVVAQTTAVVDKDIKSEADALLRSAYPADGPGAAIVVTRGGHVIYAAGQGLADVDANRLINTDTPFRLGSIVKQFTAVAVLKLASEKKLSLDDPIARFFPSWPAPTSGATVRQLLNHTSGIQDYSKVPGWIQANRDRAWTTAELLEVARVLPATAQPGAVWEYNNGGYVMLGAIIEKVSGKAWHEVVEEITQPLGLSTIAFAVPAEVSAKSARGYTSVGGYQKPIQLSHMSVAHAAGGLNGSVSDMAKWAHALHNGQVVNPALYTEMTTPARLTDGSTAPYGFGLRLREIQGQKAFVHGGAGGGLDTDSVYIPAQDLFVAVFANSDDPVSDPSILTRRFAALAMGKPFPTFSRVQVDLKTLEAFFGTYSGGRGPARRFFERDGKLFMGRGEDEREVFATSENRFFFGKDDLAWFSLNRDKSGVPVMEVHVPEAAAPILLVRAGPVPKALVVPADILQSYVGRYQTETIGMTVSIDEKGRLMMTPDTQGPLGMRAISETEFRVDGGMMRLVFHPNDGRVDSFTLHRGARVLNGKRVVK